MSASIIRSIQTLNRLAIRSSSASTPGLCLITRSRPIARLGASGTIIDKLQRRHQTTSDRPQDARKAVKRSAPPPPPPGLMQFLRRALTFRGLFSSLTPNGLKILYRQSPIELVAALAILAGLLGISAYIIKVCIEYFYARQFTKYPAPIAKSLRRALYYTNMSPDPQLAKKWYKKALEQCDELGLDPYSDDVLGIRIQTAAWLEKIGNYQGAITVLESIMKDCTKWVGAMETGIADGTIDKSGVTPPSQATQGDGEQGTQEEEEEKPENLWHKRNRLLAKAVGTSTKLGELYADNHVNDSENAHARLTWAVETALSESRRRSAEGVKPEEGKWLTPEEFGGVMESLAQHYEARDQFHLAVPLLFQALRLCQSPCHRPTIMNNLAVSFAQHPVLSTPHAIPDAPATSDALSSPGMPTTRDGLLEAAWNWAKNARRHAKDVESSERTPECDEACAVALSNMADIASLRGNATEAARWFQECIDFSKKIGFQEGVAQAEARLQTLKTANQMRSPTT
ncbi:TPR domain-containing protein [Verticillium dahliae VdLs.17]|uniref:TPR domain-containing protein n=2 Tax=Verticillium dahliae TaxID=27337 RepID=G2XEQ6_VERDV|nr:TPR domain-containing protein [Verticillium dahliae VdLs.17]KAF3349022.1 Protein RTA1 [Verticillium dahliae VDG2]KAH6709703.1 TPR domain-containing protein [Verticillium dahliae]EGY18307.1 TPR domain-containing protein [Verticillium dahliae VdLs.17]PNH29539.1 hypothetical protein BJF96_g7277 [Verticillium dahliae]PNH47993.1 hypothetical protein VD0003_g8714 [Verticillium dahliae]